MGRKNATLYMKKNEKPSMRKNEILNTRKSAIRSPPHMGIMGLISPNPSANMSQWKNANMFPNKYPKRNAAKFPKKWPRKCVVTMLPSIIINALIRSCCCTLTFRILHFRVYDILKSKLLLIDFLNELGNFLHFTATDPKSIFTLMLIFF